MARKAPRHDPGDADLEVGAAKTWVTGVPAVLHSMKVGIDEMGVARTAKTFLAVNQPDGFDCPGCAWPEPGKAHVAEFCENGAKAIAEEATLRRVTPAFFAEHPISTLATKSDHWLGQQGRITEPMHKPAGADHYEPVSWDDAFTIVASALGALDSPDQAVFYTSGRTSNEAAFSLQLFVRAFGTNNLPDCSNMCHESSGAALNETIGIGKGTVTLDDVEHADLIFVCGQNPGTNHPRMLSALEETKRNGGSIIAVNPLVEPSLQRFKHPQRPRGIIGAGTVIADQYCQIRSNGDLALFQGINKLLVEADDADGDVLDHDFIAEHTTGFDAYVDDLRTLEWGPILEACGLAKPEIEAAARRVMAADSVIICWAMGLTQHKNAVATLRELVNHLLLRGNIGRPGAGVCPVRGHSNVQGDRTMGIWEKAPESFLAALDARFAITSPRDHGLDVVGAIRAMRDGTAKVFFAMGGNFVRATPDSDVTEAAMAGTELTVHVSTKLNRSHTVTGRSALILPTMGRTEDDRTGGRSQRVTVEDSMGMVHASRGPLTPASVHLRSEVDIVCSLAERVIPDVGIDWAGMRADYDVIRDHISHVVPGFDDFNPRLDEPGGFALPNPPRDSRTFPTLSGRAQFSCNPLVALEIPAGRLVLQTVRSHDQYNTTIYGLDDRYRGVSGGRHVVFVNPDDLVELGFADGDVVDLVSEWPTAQGIEERRAEAFRIISYQTARQCAAAYFPEANVLVPLDSTADGSNTPASKSIIIRLERRP